MSDRELEPGDSEMIAALLDRQLSDPQRRDLLERLDRDEALYEVFVETVRYRESGAGEGARVIEHPAAAGRSRWILPGSVAALLVVAFALPLLLGDGGPLGGAVLARQLVEDGRLEGSLPPDWIEQGWSRTRGLSTPGSELDSAFRVGVHAVDLEVALRLGRVDEARALLTRIDSELSGIDLSDQLRLSYGELRRQLEADVPLEHALERAATVESQAGELLDLGYGYAFGKWAEAGKLAAWSGNEKLLRSRAFRKALREVQARPWTDDVDQRLAAIAAALDDRDSELDMTALAEAFTAVINQS